MPSSTSSSEPLRTIPDGHWPRTLLAGVVLFLVALAGWEAYWRSEWFVPAFRDSDGLWALTRDRIDDEDGRGVVVVSSSRLLFDLSLETWRDETGVLPIHLGLVGTNSRAFLTHVAQETAFAGLVVVGVTEGLFFGPADGSRASALQHYRDRSPADRLSQRLSMHLVEPSLAFYHTDTALFTVLRRQTFWPARSGMEPPRPLVRKLSNSRRTRQADMWDRVEHDPAYQKIARDRWLLNLNAPRPPAPPPEVTQQRMDALFGQVAANVQAIRARGGEVLFVRAPSVGPFREAEHMGFPREQAWDVLLDRVDAAGVHFEDHTDLQDVELPEWSHIRAGDTPRFTRALIAHAREALAARGTPRAELGQ
jgi:hypothetical protein